MCRTSHTLYDMDIVREIGVYNMEFKNEKLNVETRKLNPNLPCTIVDMRVATGLSQSQFACLTGIPVRTIQSWEQHARNPLDYVLVILQRMLELEGYFKEKEVSE